MYDPDKYQAARSKPLQARGKERVRLILAAALELFKEKGMEEVTTNDIAVRAQIPIGSLYRYYPNKDAIVVALTDLYINDVIDIFDNIGQHPVLRYLSWDEVLLLMVDAWVNYTRMNGPFTFLYAEKASPHLYQLNRPSWIRFTESFKQVLRKRCPEATDRELLVAFQLSLGAVDLGVDDVYTQIGGAYPHHAAVGAVAGYMLRACNRHTHGMV